MFMFMMTLGSQWAVTCTKDILKTRLQDVQNINSEDVHKT